MWILNITILLIGKSLFAMRLIPALFGALALIPLNLSVQLLGGSRKAVILASIAFILSPIYLAYCGYYSMNSIDLLLWSSAIYLVIKLQKSQDPKYWIWLGVTMGLALLNKIGMLWFGLGLFISLILTDERKWLSTRWPYLAGITALFNVFAIPDLECAA
ncbi:MAG: glycosyltransferase family 39 protein [Cyclobacteriaceae bacterium]|nr:glycosyltransferase family 39 protein [Cyclobacteriaceae bacterium]